MSSSILILAPAPFGSCISVNGGGVVVERVNGNDEADRGGWKEIAVAGKG
jgi:hypothetical protein